jgi:hypothetical protein
MNLEAIFLHVIPREVAESKGVSSLTAAWIPRLRAE